MYRPVQTAAPATTPVSMTEVKAHLDVTYTDKDTLITGLLNAAVSLLDGWSGILGRCLVTQTWRQDYDDFRSCLRLPLFPVASITSVKYLDTSSAEQTVDPANYTLRHDERGAYIEFKSTYSFPALNAENAAVNVIYVCGSAVADVPQAIKHAMLILIRHWFDNPSAVSVGVQAQTMPMAVDALLAPFRRIQF